jgi:hypothetical protein
MGRSIVRRHFKEASKFVRVEENNYSKWWTYSRWRQRCTKNSIGKFPNNFNDPIRNKQKDVRV